MGCLSLFLLLAGCALLTPNAVQATIFACNTTAPCGCSHNAADINARIVGGEPAVSHSWGWAVSLRARNRHFCGGSIISPHYVLTAAHCLETIVNPSSVDLTVVVGTDSVYDTDGQRIAVSSMHMHERWNTFTKENDIALLKLKKPIKFKGANTARLCLPDVSAYDENMFPSTNSDLVAIGWGTTSAGGVASSVLRQVTIQAVANGDRTCTSSINNVNLQFCAAVPQGGKGNYSLWSPARASSSHTHSLSLLLTDTCQGDSGGPLMFYSQVYRQWMLAGITSYGKGCGLRDYAGVYTRASVYRNWIKSIVGSDGVVVVGENSAYMSTMSNVLLTGMLAFLALFRVL